MTLHRPVGIFLLVLLGAGCLPDVRTQKAAEPFPKDATTAAVAPTNGFGPLPVLPTPKGGIAVTLQSPVPDIPTKITVLRLRGGSPNETMLRNIVASLGLPGGVLGNRQTGRDLLLRWTDDDGIAWTYDAGARRLGFRREGVSETATTTWPDTSALLERANAFLLDRSVRLGWYRAPFAIPESQPRTWITFDYRMLVDGRDVVTDSGGYVSGANVVVDAGTGATVSGTIVLPSEPDRSDYPALPKSDVERALTLGGLSGATGTVIVDAYEFASLRIPGPSSGDSVTFLVPSLVGVGSRVRSDGSREPFRVVVPLLAR